MNTTNNVHAFSDISSLVKKYPELAEAIAQKDYIVIEGAAHVVKVSPLKDLNMDKLITKSENNNARMNNSLKR